MLWELYLRERAGRLVHIDEGLGPHSFLLRLLLGRFCRFAGRVPIRDAPVNLGPDAVAVDFLATNEAGGRVERHPAGQAEEVAVLLFFSRVAGERRAAPTAQEACFMILPELRYLCRKSSGGPRRASDEDERFQHIASMA